MKMDKETKAKIIADHAIKEGDVGSADVQIALLSHRINELTEHMKVHRKDKHSERGLVRLVNKRKKLMKYLNSEDHARYLKLMKKLKIRH